ncbi:hypothetical protein WG936_11060 [Corynebacterium sp. H127]
MTIGVGTLLLVVWRFFSLPGLGEFFVWNSAVGALSVGIGYAVAEFAPQTKVDRFRLVLAGCGLIAFAWLTGNTIYTFEDLAQHAGIALIVAALLVGQSWWALGTTALLTILGHVLVTQFHISHSDPFLLILATVLGIVMFKSPPALGWVLGVVFLPLGWWQLSDTGISFMSNEQLDTSVVTASAMLLGIGLLIMSAIRMLPAWRPLASIGMHAVSIYVVTMLTARFFGEERSVSFGWTMYSPLSDAVHLPATSSFSGILANAVSWTNPLIGLAALALCALAATRRGWGPLEALLERAYRRL